MRQPVATKARPTLAIIADRPSVELALALNHKQAFFSNQGAGGLHIAPGLHSMGLAFVGCAVWALRPKEVPLREMRTASSRKQRSVLAR